MFMNNSALVDKVLQLKQIESEIEQFTNCIPNYVITPEYQKEFCHVCKEKKYNCMVSYTCDDNCCKDCYTLVLPTRSCWKDIKEDSISIGVECSGLFHIYDKVTCFVCKKDKNIYICKEGFEMIHSLRKDTDMKDLHRRWMNAFLYCCEGCQKKWTYNTPYPPLSIIGWKTVNFPIFFPGYKPNNNNIQIENTTMEFFFEIVKHTYIHIPDINLIIIEYFFPSHFTKIDFKSLRKFLK